MPFPINKCIAMIVQIMKGFLSVVKLLHCLVSIKGFGLHIHTIIRILQLKGGSPLNFEFFLKFFHKIIFCSARGLEPRCLPVRKNFEDYSAYRALTANIHASSSFVCAREISLCFSPLTEEMFLSPLCCSNPYIYTHYIYENVLVRE